MTGRGMRGSWTSRMNVRLLTRRLEREGPPVSSASSGAGAVAVLRSESGITLLGGLLPDVDGPVVLAKVGKAVPDAWAVIVSGRHESYVAGTEGYTRKPVTGPVIREAGANAVGEDG